MKIDAIGYILVTKKIKDTLLVLNDETFSDVVNRGLIRVVRIALERETKTIKRGALFFQELFPENTVFITALLKGKRGANNILNLSDILNNNIIVLGGDESLGRGIVRFKVV